MNRRYIVTVLILLVAYLYFTKRRSNYTGSPPDMLDNEKFKDIVITFPLDDSKQEFKDKFLKSEQVARWKAYIISDKGDYYEGEIDISMPGFVKISFKEIYYGGDVIAFKFHVYYDDVFGNLNNMFIDKDMNIDFQFLDSDNSMLTLTPFFASSEYNKRFIYVSWTNGNNVLKYGKSWIINVYPQGRARVTRELTHPDLFKNSVNNSIRLLIPYEVYLFKIKLEIDTIVGLRYVYLSIDEYQVLNIGQRYDIFYTTDIGESIPIKYKRTDESNSCLPAEGEVCSVGSSNNNYYSTTKRLVEYEVDYSSTPAGYYTLAMISIPESHKEVCRGCPQCVVTRDIKISECRPDGTVLYKTDVLNIGGGCTADQLAEKEEYTKQCKKDNYKITQDCQINENGVYKTETESQTAKTCIDRCKNDEECVAVTVPHTYTIIPERCYEKWVGTVRPPYKMLYEWCTPSYRESNQIYNTGGSMRCKYVGKKQSSVFSCDSTYNINDSDLLDEQKGDLVTFKD